MSLQLQVISNHVAEELSAVATQACVTLPDEQ